MKKIISELRYLIAKYLWFSIIFSISICVLVIFLMDMFVFNDFSLSTIIRSLIGGLILGIVNNKIAIMKLKGKNDGSATDLK